MYFGCHFFAPLLIILLPIQLSGLGEEYFAGCGTLGEESENLDGIVIRDRGGEEREGGGRKEEEREPPHRQTHTSMSLLRRVCSVKNTPSPPR